MTMKHLKRTVAAIGVAAVAAVAGAPLLASALDGVMNGTGAGASVMLSDGVYEFAGIINYLGTDSSNLSTYCIEKDKLTWQDISYTEGTFDGTNVPDVSHVLAVLRLGYPTVSACPPGAAARAPSPTLD